MKLLTFDKIVQAKINPLSCYDWVEEVLKRKDESILPAKISLKPNIPEVFYNVMPSILLWKNWAGVKLVTRYPHRKPILDSQILLYDLTTGKNLALVDGNWITSMRTGAVAAHSVKLLAVNHFSTIGIIGLGNTARAFLLVLLSLYPNKPLTIKIKKYKDQHDLFIKRFSEFHNIEFICCETLRETVDNADVVVSAVTFFENDVFEDYRFKEGVLVVPIHTRGFSNCDLYFDKIFADDTNHVKGFKYFDCFHSFAEVSEVLNHKKPGRENNRERIIAYNIGISLHDIFFAGKLYELLENEGEEISLKEPDDKFWV